MQSGVERTHKTIHTQLLSVNEGKKGESGDKLVISSERRWRRGKRRKVGKRTRPKEPVTNAFLMERSVIVPGVATLVQFHTHTLVLGLGDRKYIGRTGQPNRFYSSHVVSFTRTTTRKESLPILYPLMLGPTLYYTYRRTYI